MKSLLVKSLLAGLLLLIPALASAASVVTPVMGDFDGDGVMDMGVYDPGTATWTINLNSPRPWVFQFGDPAGGDVAMVIDVNQLVPYTTVVPQHTFGVFRPTTGRFYFRYFGVVIER